MDDSTRRMVAEAYDETVSEAMARGEPAGTAHKEGVTAASMFYASLAGIDDAAARGEVEGLGLKPE
jgi:hypothetical protein